MGEQEGVKEMTKVVWCGGKPLFDYSDNWLKLRKEMSVVDIDMEDNYIRLVPYKSEGLITLMDLHIYNRKTGLLVGAIYFWVSGLHTVIP